MTTPERRTRALIEAGELLQEARMFDLTEELRKGIRFALRHYPNGHEIQSHAKYLSLGRSVMKYPWLLPDDAQERIGG